MLSPELRRLGEITIDGLPETGSKKRQGTLAFRTQGILKACWIALWNP